MMIDLRSDTVTHPTEAMREAMAKAPLGDDVYGEDPTVTRLEALAAEMTGCEAALFIPSGTMGNLVCLMTHGGHGDEILVDPDAHTYYYEQGALCSIAGYVPHFVPADRGVMNPADVLAALRSEDSHFAIPRLLWLENTHNRGGGTITPPDVHRELCRVAHHRGLKVHLDGARIFNASVALGVDVSVFTQHVDSMQFCLSKGLSAPVGSAVVGPKDFIATARRVRKRLGGGMRQAGVIAAAGIVALETMIDRLAEDHAHARRLALGLARIDRLGVRPEDVQTNMVFLDVSKLGLEGIAFLTRLKEAGVLAVGVGPTMIRCCTHRHIGPAEVDSAVERFAEMIARIGKG